MQDSAEEWVQADDFVVKAKVQRLRKSFPQVRPELLKTLLQANQGNIPIVKQVGCYVPLVTAMHGAVQLARAAA